MHPYNLWLPPVVAEQAALETQAFSEAVRRLHQDWQPQEPSSSSATVKWISVINNFLKAKSELAIPDVELLVKTVLDLIFHSQDNFYIQARWGSVLTRTLKKYGKKLDLSVNWQPFYELFLHTHFKRRQTFEGVALKQFQVENLSQLICNCRRFFPIGSAAEIWAEFRPALEDLSHNASLEAAGFISLFLPTNPQKDSDFFTSEWLVDCVQLWDGVPNCQYWDLQWASLVGRCIKNHTMLPSLDMEQFLPSLFSHYLSSFEVPVGKASASYPYQREVPREVMLAFSSGWSHSLAKEIAKAIVSLLKPSGSAQKHLETMINLLEQYYHPSNGGSWTSSLERFLRNLVYFFLRRLAKEQRKRATLEETAEQVHFLGSTERKAFVKAVMRLIERGQYSKNALLAGTTAIASSGLSFIEPLLVLPLTISRFYTALDTITATHQLEAALTTVALSARSLLLASFKESSTVSSNHADIEETIAYNSNEYLTSCMELLDFAMSNTLLGLDANDPPKTLATLQLFCSIFSSIGKLGNEDNETSSVLSIDWSQWLDDFLSRLFILLIHLEPSNQLVEAGVNDGSYLSSKTFLIQQGSFYLSMLELLFARLTRPLFQQALKKVVKFVHSNTLPGAAAEVGLLCSAVVYASPQEAIVQLIGPIISSVLSSLQDCPRTGFSGSSSSHIVFNLKATLSPALETSIVYQLNVLSLSLMYGGPSVLEYEDMLKNVIAASFDAPSSKVNEAGGHLLSSVLGSIILYYPLDQYKVHSNYPGLDGIEDWISTKPDCSINDRTGPEWHSPNSAEVAFANELLDLHLKGALADLRSNCQAVQESQSSAQEKEHLRVILLRIDASLRGVRSCLPDFQDSKSSFQVKGLTVEPSYIAGAAGVSVGCTELREDAANTLHIACKYLLEKWADDSVLLSLLAHNMDMVGNYGSIEYSEWSNGKDAWRTESKSLVEPSTNFMTDHHVVGRRRPKWMVIEMSLLHNTWRASQSRYNWYRVEAEGTSAPYHITLLASDLLQLSLHNYDAVRKMAGTSLKKIFKRFPSAIKDSMPVLLNSLQDPAAPEHSALGACAVLTSRPVLRHLTQDYDALSCFLLAILNSAHHETVKAQTAINELFILFSVRFGGVPMDHVWKSGEFGSLKPYSDLINKIQSFCASTDNVHWRYNLMAQGMLLFLLVPGSKASSHTIGEVWRSRQSIAGHFLSNLKSELPALRPLSVVALLVLLQASPHKIKQYDADNKLGVIHKEQIYSLEASLTLILQEGDFGSVVIHNLSLDHHYPEGQARTRQGGAGRSIPRGVSDVSLTVWMPSFLREWPRTRTWDPTMKGDEFSAKNAKLFKRLIQECGSVALEAFRAPLEEASTAVDERGKQCAAAEVIAGFLQSDVECVIKAWDVWLRSLFQRVLLQSSIESTPEWAACVRFAVTGKGRIGRSPPLMRSLILDCLAEPLPSSASSSAVTKRFTLLCAAVTELLPACRLLNEASFQKTLLKEALNCMSNPAPQVRESVGNILCMVGSNLQLSLLSNEKNSAMGLSLEDNRLEDLISWKTMVIRHADSAVAKIQNNNAKEFVGGPDQIVAVNDTSEIWNNGEVQEAVKLMETVLYFMITSMKSGRSSALMDVIVDLLPPVLSLQETSHKDLSSLARVAMHFLKWQHFPAAYLPKAVVGLLSAAKDNNWHTRIAALTFLQSFLYRHTFLLQRDALETLWDQVEKLLSDYQVEVREMASSTLAGMMKGADIELARVYRERQLNVATALLDSTKTKRRVKPASQSSLPLSDLHGMVLGLAACVLSVPYDMPRWLPNVISTLVRFAHESPPVRTTVTKTVAEFRRTHADTWAIQKSSFTEEQLEVLTDTSSSASYFA